MAAQASPWTGQRRRSRLHTAAISPPRATSGWPSRRRAAARWICARCSSMRRRSPRRSASSGSVVYCRNRSASREPSAARTRVASRMPMGRSLHLPVPDLGELLVEAGETGARDGLYARDQIGALEAALGDVVLDDEDGGAALDELGDVAIDARRLRLRPAADLDAGGVLPDGGVADAVPAEEHVELGARAAHHRGDPQDRVVLLLGRAAVCLIDDLQNLALHGASYLVPMTSVLSEPSTAFHRSAGLPRRTPAIASPTPRSSTQS